MACTCTTGDELAPVCCRSECRRKIVRTHRFSPRRRCSPKVNNSGLDINGMRSKHPTRDRYFGGQVYFVTTHDLSVAGGPPHVLRLS